MEKTKLKPILNALKANPAEQVRVNRQWLINCLHELSVYRWKANGAVLRNKKERSAVQC